MMTNLNETKEANIVSSNGNSKISFLKKIEIATRNSKNYKNIWWTILGLTCLIVALTGIVLGLVFNEPAVISKISVDFKDYKLAAEVLAFIALGIIVLPYLYLSGSWIAGVNNTSKGPIYQLFLWCSYISAVLISVISFLLYWTMWINI